MFIYLFMGNQYLYFIMNPCLFISLLTTVGGWPNLEYETLLLLLNYRKWLGLMRLNGVQEGRIKLKDTITNETRKKMQAFLRRNNNKKKTFSFKNHHHVTQFQHVSSLSFAFPTILVLLNYSGKSVRS